MNPFTFTHPEDLSCSSHLVNQCFPRAKASLHFAIHFCSLPAWRISHQLILQRLLCLTPQVSISPFLHFSNSRKFIPVSLLHSNSLNCYLLLSSKSCSWLHSLRLALPYLKAKVPLTFSFCALSKASANTIASNAESPKWFLTTPFRVSA